MTQFPFTRRQFIGASAGLLGLSTAFGQSAPDDDIVLRFMVTSDVHYCGSYRCFPGNSQEVQSERFSRAVILAKQYSRSQPYPNFDALLVCGDMTNRGVEEEIVPFCETMDRHLPPETKRVLCMGSHEYMGGNRALWEKVCRTPADSHQVINGYHFIALSPDDTQETDGVFLKKIDWARGELAQAAGDDKERPIFFIQHYHPSRPATQDNADGSPWWLRGRATVRSTRDNRGASDLFELFQEYPRLVDFSGHSHYPISDPGAAWQGNFSAFGTGTLCYAKMLDEPYDVTPPGRFNYAQYYIVEVSRRHSVRLRIFDLASESFIPRVYFIPRPGDVTTYRYTDARIEQSPLPVWSDGATILVNDRSPDGVVFRFPQVQNIDEVQSYRVVIRVQNQERPVVDRRVWSEFYFHPMPETVEVTETSLKSAENYHIEVFARNFFDKENPVPLSADFQTPAFLPWN